MLSLLPFTALSLLAGAPGVTLSATDPLADVRAAFAAGRYDDVRAHKSAPPGLLGAALHALGDNAAACAVYAKDRATSRAPAATLRAARCLDAANDVPGAVAAWTEVSAGPFAKDALVASELAAFIDKRDLPSTGLAAIVDVEVGPFEEDRRQALGRALLVVAKRADGKDGDKVKARALERLFMELSDTDAAALAAQLPEAKKRPAEDFTQAVARATQLEKRHESDAVVAALAPFPLDGKARELSPLQCEARLLLGKSLRKLRKYSAAKKHLDTVATRCGDDVKKRGAYLAARVAWISKAGSAATLLRSFADTWPDDTLTDDVLLWLGEVKTRDGDRTAAEEAWRTIVDKHPNGDMIHEARFKLAWSLARGGDVDGARALLDDAARAATAGAASKESLVFLADRALYWRARLALAPRLDNLTATSDAKVKAAALTELASLATSRPAGWYGHMARMLVASHAPAGGAPPSVASRLRDVSARAALTTSGALASDARFTLARTLVDGGYDDEALLLLVTMSASLPTPAVAEDKFALALLMGRAGAPGTGHAFLRNAGLAVLPGTPSTDNALAWSIDWPLAYASSINAAASEHKLPPSLLFGLAREESAFDAGVVSWAGAVGLCQLMPPTAADEAADKKLPKPDIDALRDPDLNARLGAAHLARRMKLGHVALAIAAYNAGPGAVAQWSPHGPLDTFVEQIPVDETRNYVKKVTGSWVTYAILDGAVDDVAFPLTLR
jgi:soluble lytic murein transglycosylase